MEILFLILKIIGILLAVIIFLCFATLAVPVRYSVCMEVQEDLAGTAAFSWFCRLLCLNINYKEKSMAFRLRIFGIPVSIGRQKKRSPKAGRTKARKKKRETDPVVSQTKEPQVQEAAVWDDTKARKRSVSENLPEQGSGRRKTKAKKRRKKFFSGFEALRQWISDVKDKTVTGKEKFENIKKLISEETNKSAFLHLFQELKFLMRHYSPRRAFGELEFAVGDPGGTGQVLGMFSLFPFWSRYRINIIPDFQAENFYVRGRLQVKGHIRAWHFLRTAFRLIKDKNIKALITSVRT
ncbi:MAG: hypothetical protein HFI69_01765 [Lachnospiraceae bacterium]|nr:hypothetical protein [Lachnospiraceae bacterium]